METLRDLIGDRNIEELPISFTAVATQLESQKEIWLNEGSLFDAVRASIAIPTVFTPVRYRGSTLVDGGLVNPIPIAPTLRDKTDIRNIDASTIGGFYLVVFPVAIGAFVVIFTRSWAALLLFLLLSISCF